MRVREVSQLWSLPQGAHGAMGDTHVNGARCSPLRVPGGVRSREKPFLPGLGK